MLTPPPFEPTELAVILKPTAPLPVMEMFPAAVLSVDLLSTTPLPEPLAVPLIVMVPMPVVFRLASMR